MERKDLLVGQQGAQHSADNPRVRCTDLFLMTNVCSHINMPLDTGDQPWCLSSSQRIQLRRKTQRIQSFTLCNVFDLPCRVNGMFTFRIITQCMEIFEVNISTLVSELRTIWWSNSMAWITVPKLRRHRVSLCVRLLQAGWMTDWVVTEAQSY